MPIFYGLAIVAEVQVLDRHPELAALLDHLESPEGARAMVDLAERIRVDEAIFGQAWIRMLEDQAQRGADRYLELVKAVLLDERNLHHELRMAYLLGLRGAPPDLAVLRDPARNLPLRYQRLVRARVAGRADRRRRWGTWRSPPWAGPSSTVSGSQRAGCWPRASRVTSPRWVWAAGAEGSCCGRRSRHTR